MSFDDDLDDDHDDDDDDDDDSSSNFTIPTMHCLALLLEVILMKL